VLCATRLRRFAHSSSPAFAASPLKREKMGRLSQAKVGGQVPPRELVPALRLSCLLPFTRSAEMPGQDDERRSPRDRMASAAERPLFPPTSGIDSRSRGITRVFRTSH
jgi:hypothetical protein